MARIAILMLPEPGHFTPTIRIASALRDMGHDLYYFSVPQFQDFFLQQGFESHPILSGFACAEGCQDVFSVHETGGSLDRKLSRIECDFENPIVDDLSQAKADLFICDRDIERPVARAVAIELGIDVVILTSSLPNARSLAFPEVVMCPQELEIPGLLRSRLNRHYGEASIFTSRPECFFPWHRIDPQKPLVYCNFGTQSSEYFGVPGILLAIAEAFQDLPNCQLVIAAGWAADLVTTTAANVVVVRTAPQLDLLGRAALIVTHGGLGTIKEAILAETPMIVIPFLHDQPANARRVAYHGLGYICWPENCTPERVRELTSKALADGQVRLNLKRMSAIFRMRESEGFTACFVNSLLRHRPG